MPLNRDFDHKGKGECKGTPLPDRSLAPEVRLPVRWSLRGQRRLVRTSPSLWVVVTPVPAVAMDDTFWNA
jgi:hypothetical protein